MQKNQKLGSVFLFQNVSSIIHSHDSNVHVHLNQKPARTLFRDFVFIALIDFIDFCAIVFSWMNTNLVKL